MTNTPETRIVQGEHFADILVRYDEDAPPVYYWICQKFGVPEILGMGTTFSFDEAEKQARDCLESLLNGEGCPVQKQEKPPYRLH